MGVSMNPRIIKLVRGFVFIALCPGSCASLFAQSAPTSDPSETLREFLPNEGEVATKGTTIRLSAAVTLNPSLIESVEYIGTIKVNGRRRREDGAFVTVLTPPGVGGQIHADETLSWFVGVNGPKKMTVRLELSGTGMSSHTHFQFADVTRTYSVRCSRKSFVLFRFIERLFGRCS